MSAEQLEAELEWMEAQREAASKLAESDPELWERLRAQGRRAAFGAAANRLRCALADARSL